MTNDAGDNEMAKVNATDPSDVPEGILFGMGNPLLDISANVGMELLEKYGLRANNAILAQTKHLPIYEDLTKNHEVDFIPGGATQNSMRVAQWLLRKPKCATFTGCIAQDKYGKLLEANCRKLGVNTLYQFLPESEGKSTGTCAVLITGRERSLVTHLGAANCFSFSHLEEEHVWEQVKKAKFFYIAGFFLTVSMDAILKVTKHALDENKIVGMNLSAPFLCDLFKEKMMKAMPYVDFLFGNETEAAALAQAQEFGVTDVKEIALKAADLPKESSRKRVVVLTQGPDPVIVAHDGKVEEFPVPSIPDLKLVDTNGAGDAFVGGFLSQLVQGKSVNECVRCATWTANLIVQRSGCSFPDVPDYE